MTCRRAHGRCTSASCPIPARPIIRSRARA
ncbi:hypothetical protein D6C00_13840 [Thiohalobacter thiocyanaticus]|uniref:Uncharacterized protein n=1 Tax=Thiohalobacter thiocyanaticus TaxID=585455 RepID=A0A426QMB3_9GAMM|nr:hypothetical protein D6C00_13840 [Thiohalobacter thiocyanaticus]